MTTTWIITADNSRARILSMQSKVAPLTEVKNFLHPAGRMRKRELTSDRPGRTYDSRGMGRHAKQARNDPAKQELIYFTGRIAGFIETARKRADFDRLILVASPPLLGMLRKKLSSAAKQQITREIRKNLATKTGEEICQYLQ